MFPSASLLTAFIFALGFTAPTTSANPLVIREDFVKLALQRRLNVSNAHDLVRHDQARARYLRTGQALASSKRQISQPLDNRVVMYIASVGIGNPATTYDLIVDTGSSNTWIGASKPYVVTSTSKQTQDSVSVVYDSGSFSGSEYIDAVTITDSLVIAQQSIGVANTSTGFEDVDGILGIGPTGLTQGTLSPSSSEAIPTVTDNAFTEGSIPADFISLSFEPTTQNEKMNGELSWGSVDNTKFTGDLTYAPITSTSPASQYWGFDQSISYGPATHVLSYTAGIVDSRTTLILLATDAFNRYVQATGAQLDSTTGLLTITSSQFANLQSLFFTIAGAAFEFTANAQIWPRSLNTVIGGTDDTIYLVVANLGSPSGQGLDFICGYAFLERFYTVYDTANSQVGFATTPFTHATTN